MERNFLINFPEPFLPFIPPDISICCITNEQNPKSILESEPDRIFVWQDISLAKTLSQENGLNCKVWLALPINLSYLPYNAESLLYNISSKFGSLAKDLPDNLTRAREKQLRQLTEIYDKINNQLLAHHYIKKDKIVILLDGDESHEELEKIIRLAKAENPLKQLSIIQLNKIYTEKKFKKTLKLFSGVEIFECEKVYTVKSVMAFYLFMFCETLVYDNNYLQRKKFFMTIPTIHY